MYAEEIRGREGGMHFGIAVAKQSISSGMYVGLYGRGESPCVRGTQLVCMYIAM